MNVQQKGIITLIKSALIGKCYELSESFSLGGVIDVAKEHQISPLLYYGAINCGFDKNSEKMRALFNNAFPLVMLDEAQKEVLAEICEDFRSKGIDHMPLKGSVLKSLYPKSEMRSMGDVDILIKTEQYDIISEIMKRKEYEFQYESDHELVWKKGNVLVELHKSVMTSYNKDFFAYFSNGWNLAQRKNVTSEYSMSDEDFYIYMFVHFTKHYRISGIGIKHLTDLWVYKNAKPELDWQYIKNELKKLRLHEFFENVEETLDVWFSDAVETFETKLVSDMVFGSGAYGNAKDAATSKIIREAQGKGSFGSVKLANRLRTIFIPYKQMCGKYKILEKVPFLLPVMWIARLFNVIMFKQDRMRNYIEKEKRLTNDTIYERKEKLNAVGLDFYSEENVK